MGDAVGLRALGHAPGRLEGGCRVPVRLASGPVTQPVRVVDVLVLIGGKVPAGTSIVGDLRLAARPAAMAEDGRPAGGGASHRWQAADFEQLEAERLDLREHAVQRRAVRQRPGQHGVAAARPGLQGGERAAYRLAQVAADADAVPLRRVVGCAGHVLTTGRGDPPAGGGTVVGTCMLVLLMWRILTVSLGAGTVSGHRMIRVILAVLSARASRR